MTTVKETFEAINGWIRDIIEIGLSLALIFLIVDLLFGQKIGIVQNVTMLINSFVSQGIIGLIALIVFIAIYRR